VPAWILDFDYAEQFGGVQPQDVRKTVKVKWWYRWLVREQANTSRTANIHAANADDPKELSAEERRALRWSTEEDNG
jgi:hypothetical protein